MNANRDPLFKLTIRLSLLAIILLSACAPQEISQGDPTKAASPAIAATIEPEQALPAAPSPLPTSLPAPTAAPSLTPIKDDLPAVLPTLVPTSTEVAPTLAEAPTFVAAPTLAATQENAELYRVAYVTANDVLNVRSGPGVENEISGTFSPDARDILITGPGQQVAGSSWVPVAGQGVEGWANSRYLTGQVSSAAFCADTAVMSLLEQVETAIANEDSELLAQLVHPQHGLRLRKSWWNPEIYLQQADMNDLFSSSISYEWGIEDGSGLPITGTFRQIILPRLQENLLGATLNSCNQIEHGPTAGAVRLPDGYQNVNHYSYFRPATDAAGFDWGTWVIGIEFWQSEPVLSYLVFYEYEI